MALLNDLEVVRPTTLAQALAHLRDAAERGQPVRPMAGCTDLLVDAHFGKTMPPVLLDLSALRQAIGGLRWREDGLHIGAMASYADALADPKFVEQLPALAQASALVGATQIQMRGTFAGNVENGSPAADAVPALMALDAAIVLQNQTNTRQVPLSEYYIGYRKTQRQVDELITAIVIPQAAIGKKGQWFRKVGTRAYQAITKVGIAAQLDWQGETLQGAKIVAISMAASTTRCPQLEQAMIGKTYAQLQGDLFRTAQTMDLKPIDDVRSNHCYRAEVFGRLLQEALRNTHQASA